MSLQNPRRVLHVIHRMRPGGAQTLVMNLFRHIDRNQVQFDFAVRSHRPEFYDEEIKSLGGRLFHLPWNNVNPFKIIAYTHALETVLREKGPFDGVHSHVGLFNGHVLPIGEKISVPLRIAHSHSNFTDKFSLLRRIWGRTMRHRIQTSATHLLACSPAAAEWLYGPRWQQDTRFTLFPNSFDLSPYAKIYNDRFYWRQRMGLPVDGPLVGHIGRFDKVKNHSFLIELFSSFLYLFPDAKLILVGEGNLKARIKRAIVEKGIEKAVHFLGARSDIPQILGALDLFVFPSLYEGLGIVLIEAQAAGVPCLASDTVPQETDLGLGLVQFKSLDAGAQEWTGALQKLTLKKAPNWEIRKDALKDRGFDIYNGTKLLQELYLLEASQCTQVGYD